MEAGRGAARSAWGLHTSSTQLVPCVPRASQTPYVLVEQQVVDKAFADICGGLTAPLMLPGVYSSFASAVAVISIGDYALQQGESP